MNFYDHVKIFVKAGNGGNGCIAFHREKYISHGGPSGGDGGNGGSIVFRVDKGTNTLLAYRYKHHFFAQDGGNGSGEKFHGANAEDLILTVPEGTLIKDAATGKIIHDMSENDGADFVCCRGGRGGWGNKHFATPTRQAPQFAKNGTRGEERELALELKMIADVGLIGYPSVGKSSLLAAISAARPKIADYHFTTLSPNLGVVEVENGQGFVAADIPGLIDGAAEGAGLGHDFLRHIERCRLLLHVVDISCFEGRDPVEDVKNINAELEKYSPELAKRPQIIVANKVDALDESVVDVKAFEDFVDENGWEMIYVSAATHEGIRDMILRVSERLKLLPPITIYESEVSPEEALLSDMQGAGVEDTTIRAEGGVWYVEGDWIYNLMGRINFDDYESLNYFQRVLQQNGVFRMLEEKGCRDGNTVSIYDFEFDYVK
ncbi:MAG: GTPase ObgE [Clostridia bacterium]|nr:GTPase ObgE [Clostridia bacterium]